MLYREIIAVCSEIHTKHTNTAVWAESRVFFLIFNTVVHIVTSGLKRVSVSGGCNGKVGELCCMDVKL